MLTPGNEQINMYDDFAASVRLNLKIIILFYSYTNAGHGGALMVASNFKVSIAHCDFHNNSALPYLQLVPLTYRFVISVLSAGRVEGKLNFFFVLLYLLLFDS